MKESPLVLLVGTPLACTQDLRAEGFQVELAADLAGGIALARNGIFGLVVLDLELPGCQGLDALCRFYQAVPGVPLLVLAGPEKLGIVTEAIAHGAQDCLFKDNLTAVVLVQAVRSAIARSAFQKSRIDHRMLLHAWRIRFAHPVSGTSMQVEAPLDRAFADLLQRFGWRVPAAE